MVRWVSVSLASTTIRSRGGVIANTRRSWRQKGLAQGAPPSRLVYKSSLMCVFLKTHDTLCEPITPTPCVVTLQTVRRTARVSYVYDRLMSLGIPLVTSAPARVEIVPMRWRNGGACCEETPATYLGPGFFGLHSGVAYPDRLISVFLLC